MRHVFYQNFYETLKKFVRFDDFSIEFELFKEVFTLTFNKNLILFNVSSSYRRVQNAKPESIYPIIKSYVEKQIAKNQKQAFNGSLEEKANEFISLDNNEYEIFCQLEEKFKMLLWEEPISPHDISIRGCIHRLGFGFNDSKVCPSFFANILEVMHQHSDSFKNGRIEYWMWGNLPNEKVSDDFKESINILVEEGYLVISQENFEKEIFTVAFTEKFYEAFKKSFYYDYDPKVVRPRGCIYSCS